MPQTLLAKIKILVAATLHSIVDRALESNSLAVFDEYIRDAEQSMETLKSALADLRSEEHTSELQSQSNLVCRLLLEQKTIPDRVSHAVPRVRHPSGPRAHFARHLNANERPSHTRDPRVPRGQSARDAVVRLPAHELP